MLTFPKKFVGTIEIISFLRPASEYCYNIIVYMNTRILLYHCNAAPFGRLWKGSETSSWDGTRSPLAYVQVVGRVQGDIIYCPRGPSGSASPLGTHGIVWFSTTINMPCSLFRLYYLGRMKKHEIVNIIHNIKLKKKMSKIPI